MSSFPPPTGRPVTMFPRPDPWAEQQRRQEEHRAKRWRRRRKWLLAVAVLAVAAAGVAAVFIADAGSDRASSQVPVTTQSVAPSPDPGATAPATTVAPDELIEVDQVWLIDRGDGVFDWGVSVRTPSDAPTRSGVVIDVRLLGDDDEVIEQGSGEVNGVGEDSIGAVAGRFSDPNDLPVRLEFDIAVGIVSNDQALGDVLDVRGLDRDPEVVSGRIRAQSAEPVEDVTMVLLWFDDAGDVVAAVPQPVDQVRPDVDARFEIDLSEEVVPEGRPDSIVWTR